MWIVVAGIAAVVVTQTVGDSWGDGLTDAVFAFALLGPMTGVPIVVTARKGEGWTATYNVVVNRRAVLVGLVGGVGTPALSGIALVATEALTEREVTAATTDSITGATTSAAITIQLIGVLWAPVAEELAFRGLLWGAAAKRWMVLAGGDRGLGRAIRPQPCGTAAGGAVTALRDRVRSRASVRRAGRGHAGARVHQRRSRAATVATRLA